MSCERILCVGSLAPPPPHPPTHTHPHFWFCDCTYYFCWGAYLLYSSLGLVQLACNTHLHVGPLFHLFMCNFCPKICFCGCLTFSLYDRCVSEHTGFDNLPHSLCMPSALSLGSKVTLHCVVIVCRRHEAEAGPAHGVGRALWQGGAQSPRLRPPRWAAGALLRHHQHQHRSPAGHAAACRWLLPRRPPQPVLWAGGVCVCVGRGVGVGVVQTDDTVLFDVFILIKWVTLYSI